MPLSYRLLVCVFLFATAPVLPSLAQVYEGDFQKEEDSIQLYRAQYFDEMRRFADGSLPDVWQAFQQMRQATESRNPVPAANWQSLGPNAMDSVAGRMTCHAFNPLNTQTLLAGSAGGGLWKTTDGAETWAPLTDDLPSLRISAVAYNPEDTTHLLMGTGFYQGQTFTLVPGIGLLESFDGGETWLPNSLEFAFAEEVSINRIVWDKTDPNNIFVAASNGLWVSNNRGESWDNTLTGLISDLEMVAANPERLFAAVHSTGIYRSDNGGQEWVLLTNGLPNAQNMHRINIAVCDSAPDFVMASIVDPADFGLTGLYKTSNGGDTWQLVPNPPNYLCDSGCLGWFVNVVEVSPIDTNVFFLGGPRLYSTTNGGESYVWKDYYSTPFGSSKIGLTYIDQWDVAIDPENPDVVYSLNDGGVFKSYNNGAFWQKKNEGLVTGQFYRIASFSGDTNLIIGGIQDHGLHYLDNSGGNTDWDIWYIGDGCSVNFDPNNPNRAYGDNIFAFHYRTNNVTGGLFSTNAINTGITGSSSVPFNFVTTHHPTQSFVLYTANDNHIFKTTTGANWNPVANISNVRAIAISPVNPSTIYAATYNSSVWPFYVSFNDGESWSQTAATPGWRVTDVEGDPNHHGTVYATRNSAFVGNPHVYKSTDHGASWTPISNGLPDIPTWTIAINPFDSEVLYVGTDLGVFISENGGESWSEYNDNLPPYYVMDMHYHPLDSTLRIATLGRGVWKTKSIPDFGTNTTAIDASVTNINVYPNPFAEAATISITMERPANVRLDLLNVLGQKVSSIHDGNLGLGEQRFNLDAKGARLSPGVYFVRLQVGRYKSIKQVILH